MRLVPHEGDRHGLQCSTEFIPGHETMTTKAEMCELTILGEIMSNYVTRATRSGSPKEP